MEAPLSFSVALFSLGLLLVSRNDWSAPGLASTRDDLRSLLTSPTETSIREETVRPPASWASEAAHAKTRTAESPHSGRAALTSRVSGVLFSHPTAPTAATLRPPKTERATATFDKSKRRVESAMVAGARSVASTVGLRTHTTTAALKHARGQQAPRRRSTKPARKHDEAKRRAPSTSSCDA